MSGTDPWILDEIEPTNFIVLWPDMGNPGAGIPGPGGPTFVEVASLLSSVVDGAVEQVDEIDSDDPEIEWSAVVRFGRRETPVILWCEPFKPESTADESFDVAGVRWVIGFETLLDPDDPISDYDYLLRSLARAFDDAPAVLDINTTRWIIRDELREMFIETDVEMAAELLWIIHVVNSDEDDKAGVWLHTHGLWRCGLPELEILDVPEVYQMEAGRLINTVAELLFENDLPGPGEVFSPGPEIDVVVQPWLEAAKFVQAGTPGSLKDREQQDADIAAVHMGVRAVICDPAPRGTYKSIWAWPLDALERMKQDDVVLFRTQRATIRQALVAQSSWPELAMAFASLKSDDLIGVEKCGAELLIKAMFTEHDAVDSERIVDLQSIQSKTQEWSEEEREHLWFEIADIKGDRACGLLLNDPVMIDSMRSGDSVWIERRRVSDWSFFTPHGTVEAGQVKLLRDTVDTMRQSAAGDDNDDS